VKSKEILLQSVLLILLLFLFSACGKKGPLKMPEIVVPQAIRDLKAKAEGNAIILNLSIPTKNTDGSPLNDLRGFKILRSMRKLSEGCENCPRKFITLVDIEYQVPAGQLPLKGEKKEFRDTTVSSGTEYQYKVLSYNSRDEFSRESNVAKAFWDFYPSPPQGLIAEAGNGMVNVWWEKVKILSDGSLSPEPIFYNCYRAEKENQFSFEPVNEKPIEGTSYQDVNLKNDQPYTFRVHAVRKVGDGWVESEGSSTVSAIPVDLVPPSIPQGLTAFWTDGGISLRWEGSPEPDVLGYNIYRKEEGEINYRRLNPEPLKGTIFLDTEVKRDKQYSYAISAVDNSSRRNESPLSEEVKVAYFP
jgi:predicted small lipoprotein YifL